MCSLATVAGHHFKQHADARLPVARHLSPKVLKLVLYGTFLVVGTLFILLCVSFLIGNTYVLSRLITSFIALIYLAGAWWITRKGRLVAASIMLVVLYGFLAAHILTVWSINASIGILTLGFVIILAGRMLGSRYTFPTTLAAIALLFILQSASAMGIIHPDISGISKPSTVADVISYATIFGVFAFVSWLAGQQTEQALEKALEAEAELEKEKSLLASRLEERTKQLREAQLEEMRQLYRFAEMGQLSAVMVHELANYLSVLTLDIDDIQQRHSSSDAVARAKESIGYLDRMVGQAQRQLRETSDAQEFDPLTLLRETNTVLAAKARKAGITLRYDEPANHQRLRIMGDPLRLGQIMTILVTNAIDAYSAQRIPAKSPIVIISPIVTTTTLSISVTDFGVGIKPADRSALFEPFRSRKKHGMGIGLFIAKQVIETHFKGKLELNPRTDCTSFVITLPQHKRFPRKR